MNEIEEIGLEVVVRNYYGLEEKGKFCFVVSNKCCWNIWEIVVVDIDSFLEIEKFEEEGEEIVVEFEWDIVEVFVWEMVCELNI